MTHDPNSNRMFTKDLGACNRGCKCQTQWLISWENGEITDKDLLTDHPAHLRSLQKELDSGRFEELPDGTVRNAHSPDDWPYGLDFDITYETVTVNGVRYYKNQCDFVSEMFFIVTNDIEKQLACRGDGFYVVMLESACYSSSIGLEGEEADNDWVIQVLNDEPISADEIDSVDLDRYEVK